MDVFALTACSNAFLEDCPDRVLADDTQARFRTSHFRIQLADTALAARHVLPFALMAAYAYADGPGCAQGGNSETGEARRWREALGAAADSAASWRLEPSLGSPGGCEDEQGLLFHVWVRHTETRDEVVLSFRGTNGWNDWWHGNLWPVAQFFTDDHQYGRARAAAGQAITTLTERARAAGRPPPIFRTTGHSLGGGLAQHVLYSHPAQVLQAVVFDPSHVTGFVSLRRELQAEGCRCRADLEAEARILRVYESYEILSLLRLPHKAMLPPERHVQELRFPFKQSWNPVAQHGMASLAHHLKDAANASSPQSTSRPWYASADASCTARLQDGQARSCAKSVQPADWTVCPH
jgi:pimeloyl-ACP methyl ester carboxylesterase